MASDYTVTNIELPLTSSRRYFRVSLYRDDSNTMRGEVLLRDGYRNSDNVEVMSNVYMIELTDDQVKGTSGFSGYVSGLINVCNDLKVEYDTSGSLATGSIRTI